LVVWNHGIFWLSRNSWECHHPNISEIHHFSGGVGQPPSRLLLTIINHIVNHIFSQLKTSIFPASQSALHCLHQDHAKHAAPHAAPGGAGTLRLRLGCVSLG
jgi:hypothetical protein